MSLMTAEDVVIRLNPAEFWSATRLMSNVERDTLFDAISRMAEAGDLDGLRHFSFISFTHRPNQAA